MLDRRKHAISIRLGGSDIRNIKRLAKRLQVRDSDIIRFAVKSMLDRMSPMCDEAISGRRLVPLFVEFGDDLVRYFELDVFRLDAVINERAEGANRVAHDDIALLAMGGLREHYLLMRIKDASNSPAEFAQPDRQSLRGYLYDKYVYRTEEPAPSQNFAEPARVTTHNPAA